MGLVIGVIFIAVALIVGLGLAAVANKNVRNFKEEQYVKFIPQYLSKKVPPNSYQSNRNA